MIPVSLYIVDNCLLSRVTNSIYFSKSDDYPSFETFEDISDFNVSHNDNIKIIISDLIFPGLNGIEEIKNIKRKYPDAKIIIYTANEDANSILASLSNGASAYISKRKTCDLKSTIEKVLRNEFYMDLRMASDTFSAMSNFNYDNIKQIEENQRLKDCLTKREIEVLKLLADGKTNTQIADAIVISANTAKAHVGSIFSKLSVKDRVQAAVKAIKANIL